MSIRDARSTGVVRGGAQEKGASAEESSLVATGADLAVGIETDLNQVSAEEKEEGAVGGR